VWYPLQGIQRDSLVVRKREGHAEWYQRVDNDGPKGIMAVKKSEEASNFFVSPFCEFLLVEYLKNNIGDTRNYRTSSVVDGELDSRPVKIVTLTACWETVT
jgi:hypothetical protein